MLFHFVPMQASYAKIIADWHYEGIYAFYDLKADPEDLAEFLNPDRWGSKYFAALDQAGELVGYFYFDLQEDAVTLGLGLDPALTGRGLGLAFTHAGLGFARQRFAPAKFYLQVATFNRRAIRVY
jgi:ribosomal-protein-alanine N-acetyltransferase